MKQIAPALGAIAGALFTYIKWSHSAYQKDIEVYRKLWKDTVKDVDKLNEDKLRLKNELSSSKAKIVELKLDIDHFKSENEKLKKEMEETKNE